jgi:FkbH-like protein
LDEIALDPYEYPGVAYYRFQSEVLSIAEKGVLICLCSKNDEASVWQALDQHPHCLLKRSHLAGYRINWTDKATNIKDLALELNLSPDSMVFVDDDPAECELVRSRFPEASVIQVPKKTYEFPGMLKASGLFDRLSVSQEDKDRVQYYQAEKGRRDLQQRHLDPQGFLKDLAMKAVVRQVQKCDIPRVAQLCQRTNQFNLTSRRYTESDIASFLDAPEVKMFVLQAEDRFGPIGQSGVIIFRRADHTAQVDTFLMSCRIIGRMLDQALFCESLRQLGPVWSFDKLHAAYVPTQKNGIVSGLWREYGFATSNPASANAQHFACNVKDLKVTFPAVVQLQEQL